MQKSEQEAALETLERLIVDVARLDKDGENYKGELVPEALDYGDDEFLKPVGGMKYDLFIEDLQSELLVRGKVSQTIQCVCSRCGVDFAQEVEVPDFVRSIEINDRTDFVDLTEELREAIILTFPAYPICKESCKGVCFKCGKNLNEGPCGCRDEEVNFGAFSSL